MMPLWMSEEEAKQRWCPYFRDTIEGMGSYSRIDQRELKQQEDGTKKWVPRALWLRSVAALRLIVWLGGGHEHT